MRKEILRLALPAIISNITVPLLGLVDIVIVGHMADERYIAAIAVGTMVFNVLYWVMAFLRMGTSGLTSQALGRGDVQEQNALLCRTLAIGCGTGLLFIILQWPLQLLTLWMMQVEQETAPLVSIYFNICIWGAPAVLGMYGLTGWFIGMQTTKIPMMVAIAQNVVNILLSAIFVYVLGMQIEGVALGTTLAQWFAFGISMLMVKKVLGERSEVLGEKLWKHEKLREFFMVNRDIFLRTLCIVSINMYFTSAGSAQGSMTLAANTLLMTLFTIFSYFMDGFAYAGEAMAGKLYGAGKHTELKRLEKKLLIWGMALGTCFTLLYIYGGRGFLCLLTDETDVIDEAMNYITFAMAVPLLSNTAFILDGIFIGLTRTRDMLMSCATAAVFFFGIYLIFSPAYGNIALWAAYLASLVVRGITLLGDSIIRTQRRREPLPTSPKGRNCRNPKCWNVLKD